MNDKKYTPLHLEKFQLSQCLFYLVLKDCVTGYLKGRDIANHNLSFETEFLVLPILS